MRAGMVPLLRLVRGHDFLFAECALQNPARQSSEIHRQQVCRYEVYEDRIADDTIDIKINMIMFFFKKNITPPLPLLPRLLRFSGSERKKRQHKTKYTHIHKNT